jgi:hypothetical protein
MMRQMASLLALAKEMARAESSVLGTPLTGSSQRLCEVTLSFELDVQFAQRRSTLGGRLVKAASNPSQRKLV